MIRLLADENMVGLSALESPGLQIRTLPGRAMDRSAMKAVDALWVRSVTPVTAQLLADSPVRFVGTATAGTEHVDVAWLRDNGIAFSAAPGSNANAVVEYVLAALLETGAWQTLEAGGSLGIVGYGHVGRRLASVAARLGWRIVVSDPPLAAAASFDDLIPVDGTLADVLACDVISLHCALEREGIWPSHHLIGVEELEQLGSHQVLINASRGAVLDNAALYARLAAGQGPQVVLDVWEGEPAFDVRLLDFAQVRIATPHIAGYSFDARHQATLMLYERLGDQYPELSPYSAQNSNDTSTLEVSVDDDVGTLLRRRYRIEYDDQRFRGLQSMSANDRAQGFDRLRKEYPLRRELARSAIQGELRGEAQRLYAALVGQ